MDVASSNKIRIISAQISSENGILRPGVLLWCKVSFGRFLALSITLSLKFVMRIAFTVLIGYYADKFLGTFPVLLIGAALLGVYLGWIGLVKVEIKDTE